MATPKIGCSFTTTGPRAMDDPVVR